MRIAYSKTHPNKKIVVVVGGGFAGINAVKILMKQKDVHVVLVDRRNHHLFQPLLYPVATAGLDPADIAVPIRAQFSGATNVSVHMAKIDSVNLNEKFVLVDDGVELEYDYLILACGACDNYFGKPKWEDFAPGLKSLEQATEIRRRTLLAFELAENELNPENQRALLNFVVVGGGPTGVELSGAIADISRTVLLRDFRRINPACARIILLEAGPRILATFSESLAAHAARDLAHIGVEVHTGSRVEQIDESGVQLEGKRIPSRTVLWAAGVQAPEMTRTLGVELDHAGRIKVGPDLSIANHPEVFVIGDLVHFDLPGGKALPGLAPAAIQTGHKAARNILAEIRGLPRTDFHYRDKGQMATIGKRKAIVQSGPLKLTGYLAWLAWLFVHIIYLAGFRSRVAVFFKWAWSYAFSKRGSRLIMNEDWRTEAPPAVKEEEIRIAGRRW